MKRKQSEALQACLILHEPKQQISKHVNHALISSFKQPRLNYGKKAIAT